MLNGLSPEAWAGIAGIIGVALGAVAAAVKGSQKTPIEVGYPPPPDHMERYTLAEIRALRKEFEKHVSEVERRFDEAERAMALVHQDTQVLRDRRQA